MNLFYSVFVYTLKNKGYKRVFLVPKRTFQWTVPKKKLKNFFKIERNFFDNEEPFLHLKGSMGVEGSYRSIDANKEPLFLRE